MSSSILGSFSNTRYRKLFRCCLKKSGCCSCIASTMFRLQKICKCKLKQLLHIDYKKTKKCLDHGFHSCMRRFEFQDACTFLRNATEKIHLLENVRKRMFFINVAIKYEGVKKFLGGFSPSVFNNPNTISTTKKTRDDETNSKTYEVKKSKYRIYITSLDFEIKQKHHTNK